MKKLILGILFLLAINCSYGQNWSRIGNGFYLGTIDEIVNDYGMDRLLMVGGFVLHAVGDSTDILLSLDQSGVKSIKSTRDIFATINCYSIFILDGQYYLSVLNEDSFDYYGIRKFDQTTNSWPIIENSLDHHIAVAEYNTINNEVILGGYFSKCGNDTTAGICRFDGENFYSILDPNKITDANFTGATFREFIEYKGKLYVAGNFDYYNSYGEFVHDFAYIEDGEMRSTGFDGGGFGYVEDLEVYNNELYLGGYFVTGFGLPSNFIAKWDGNQFFDVGGGTSERVFDIISYQGLLYIGGVFDYGGSTYSPRVIAWNGTEFIPLENDNAFVPGKYVTHLAIYHNELYIGGNFRTLYSDIDTFGHVAKYNRMLPGSENELEIYLNNPGEEIIINYEDTNNYALSVAILNVAGQQIGAYVFPQQQGYLHQSIQVTGLASGVYIVTAIAGDKKITKKLLKTW